MDTLPQQVQTLQQQVDTLTQQVTLLAQQLSAINLDTQVKGMIEVVAAAPTAVPHTLYDQFKIYVNSTTYRLYCYDWNAHAWHYVALT